MKKIFLVGVLVFFFGLSPKLAKAQVAYEDVVEKIHFTDPDRRVGPDNHPLESSKSIGASSPLLRAYIYADLASPYSYRFFTNTFRPLRERYENKVQFIYKHNPFMQGEDSVRTGMIIECADIQGQFWPNLQTIGEKVGQTDAVKYLQNIDQTNFESCMSDPTTKSIVTTSGNDATQFGFNGNPIMIIQNTQHPDGYSMKVSGNQDITIFDRAMEEAEVGDPTKQQLEAIQVKVDNLQNDVVAVQVKQSQLEIELGRLRTILDAIISRINALFGK